MIKINKDIKIKDVTNIINENTPSFSGIAGQECKGNLWVDNIDKPRIAIAESYAVGGFAFLGTYEAEEDFIILKSFLEVDLFPNLKKNGHHCFEFSVESERIHKHILELFSDKLIQTEKEFSFRAYKAPISNLDIPEEYQLSKVDDIFWNMLMEGKFGDQDLLRIRILESWHSFEEFKSKSVAYCITYEDNIVAVMVGTARIHNVIAIDIETDVLHRRRGLANAMAIAFISDCLRNGLIPQWDCVESNPNSSHLAEKLGFEKMNENTVYRFDI